jgi:methylmalonyl-CoA/ethylmalonyl-CoA epimerase
MVSLAVRCSRVAIGEGRGSLAGVLPLNLHHTAIAVRDLDSALAELKRQYGVDPLHREVVEAQGVEEAMVPVGGSYIQVLMPLSDDSPVGRFLGARGEGLHHLAIQVADIEASIAHLTEAGVDLIDREPRVGGGGLRIAFVHPRAFGGTLIELVEVR